MKYRFYKENCGWYIDLSWFPFNKKHLEMVCNADLLLDQLAEGRSTIELEIRTSPIPYSDGVLTKIEELDSIVDGVRPTKNGLLEGRIYSSEVGYTENKNAVMPVLWLCAVTLLVFWKYPKKIYFKVVR